MPRPHAGPHARQHSRSLSVEEVCEEDDLIFDALTSPASQLTPYTRRLLNQYSTFSAEQRGVYRHLVFLTISQVRK